MLIRFAELIGKLKVPTFADLQKRRAEVEAQEAQFAAVEEAILQKQLEAQAEAEEWQDAYECQQIEFSNKIAEETEDEPSPVPEEEPKT